MNDKLQDFARQNLKEGLAQLPEDYVCMFKKMYSHKDISLDINDVVDRMPEAKLDWAMQQVDRSINKLKSEPRMASVNGTE